MTNLVCRGLGRYHSALLADPRADQRILRLTKEEEKRLLLRLEQITSLQDLRHMEQRMHEQLGIRVRIEPGASEVRTVRGIQIEVLPMRGLCSKTRQAIPAAIRRGMERTPEVAFELLDEGGVVWVRVLEASGERVRTETGRHRQISERRL